MVLEEEVRNWSTTRNIEVCDWNLSRCVSRML